MKSLVKHLNEAEVRKLPFLGPISKKIDIIRKNKGAIHSDVMYIQRSDAFTTNLLGLLKRLEEKEVSEITYSWGVKGNIRIFLDMNDELSGEYSYKSENALTEFKKKMSTS